MFSCRTSIGIVGIHHLISGDKFGLIVENNGDGENSNYSFFMRIRERGGKGGVGVSTECILDYGIENQTVAPCFAPLPIY